MKTEKKQTYSLAPLANCIRTLSADAIENAQSGHPGMALGFADVLTSLVCNFLRFNPLEPKWFNRDRLVLSAGHGSMLLYSFLYLAGYKDFTLDDIKSFRQMGSKAAGHPEMLLHSAVETTTGPLGQGIANAIGMAIAAKKYQARLGAEIADYKIYAIIGDGCLMEGISYEALSLAGHLKLDNLIILFDDNSISIDGQTSLATSQDHIALMRALGFSCYSANGHDYQEINDALSMACTNKNPSFISFKTVIAKGSQTKEGSEKSHGSPLGAAEIEHLKKSYNFPQEPFALPDQLLTVWREIWRRNEEYYQDWQKRLNSLDDQAKAYMRPRRSLLVPDLSQRAETNTQAEATRVSAGRVIEEYLRINDKLIIGSADLRSSNGLANNLYHPITAQDFSGNFLHYGVREHAMGAIMNGLILSGFYAIGGTFLVFSDYMRPAIRLAAIMQLPAIFVMTHDSIGVGEDGATHQPVEHLASMRAMPNVNVFRPADFIETQECYELAAQSSNKPSVMALSRQNLPQIRSGTSGENLCAKGGYIIAAEADKFVEYVVIFATGSEVSLALQVQEILQSKGSIGARVVSVPCMEILLEQGEDYLAQLKGKAKSSVAIEAACGFGWHRIIGAEGMFFGVNEFGHSAPASVLYEYFGLSADVIADKVGFLR